LVGRFPTKRDLVGGELIIFDPDQYLAWSILPWMRIAWLVNASRAFVESSTVLKMIFAKPRLRPDPSVPMDARDYRGFVKRT
jgi:hypothetical protein